MVSNSFFVASGWRAVLAAPGIAMGGQIDVRPPVYNPAFVHDRIASTASPGASATLDLVRRSRKFVGDFPRLRLLDGPRFNAKVLSHKPMRRQFGNLASQSR
jgi:hypothetical protein